MPTDDNELMSRVVKRDVQAFRELYDRHGKTIYNFILRMAGRAELAEDLLQDCFTRVWCSAHTYDLKGMRFLAWLYAIARNVTRSEMSKKRYRTETQDVASLSLSHPDGNPEEKAEAREREQAVASALAALPTELREIVVFKNYQQLKFREIALITGAPEGTLKARYHRAVLRLRELLLPEETS